MVNLDAVAAGVGGFKIIGENFHDGTGISVSSAGDVNGDGLNDFIFGVNGDDTGGFNAGMAYVGLCRPVRFPLTPPFRLAAEQGNADAQDALDDIYRYGEGAAQRFVEAVGVARLAAEQGRASAQNNLGVMYGAGKGVPQDYVQAHMWYNLAAAKDNEKGRDNRDIIAEKMTPADISKAQALAREWLEKHSE